MWRIAEELGISRKTIHRWIKSGEVGEIRYKPRPPVPTKLDPYKPIILERLRESPDLTAVRLFEEARAWSCEGLLR